jgi:hypothetical protein
MFNRKKIVEKKEQKKIKNTQHHVSPVKYLVKLGIVVDGEVVESFAVDSKALAALFLSNPEFIDLTGK